MFLSRGFRLFIDTKTRFQLAKCVPSASSRVSVDIRRSSQDPLCAVILHSTHKRKYITGAVMG